MRSFRRTTLITAGCLSVLAGLGLARKVIFNPTDWWLLTAVILVPLIRRKNITALILVIFAGLLVGLWHGGIYMQKLAELKSYDGHAVTIQATATADAVYGKNQQLDFTANHVKLENGKPLAGSFHISGFGTNMVYRGDTIKVHGKLFSSRGANQARMGYAQISVTAAGHSWYTGFARRFGAGMQNALPEPTASFGMGLLVGQRSNMPADIIAALTTVGLVHIVAVSGYNLTIIIRGIQRLKPRSKYQQLALSLALIGAFLAVTGFSASIVRAAIVSGLSLIAWYFGRSIKPAALISFAAALTALVKPFYIWGDMSWYLSFLAFFGVMIIAPIIQARFFRRQPKFITIVLIETLSAELMTLPLIIFSFNQLSIVGLLANLIIVPLVPLAMLVSAVAGSAGMLVPQLSGWLAWPATILLTYMLDVVHLMSQIPSALLKVAISPAYMLEFYGLLLLASLGAARKVKLRATLGKPLTP